MTEPGTIEMEHGPEPTGMPESASLRSFALARLGMHVLPDVPSGSEGEPPEMQFLRRHIDALGANLESWGEMLDVYLSEPAPEDFGVLGLAERFRLTPTELMATVLAATVEEYMNVGRALSYLQAPIGGARPTLGLLTTVFAHSPEAGSRAARFLSGNAIASGLLQVADASVPAPERTVFLPDYIHAALHDRDGAPPGLDLLPHPEITLPSSVRDAAAKQARALLAAEGGLLVARVRSHGEGGAVGHLLAEELGLRPAFVEDQFPAGFAPWCALRGVLPVFRKMLAPSEQHRLTAPAHYVGPLVALLGPDGSVDADVPFLGEWRIPMPEPLERVALWKAAIGDTELAERLGTEHRHSTGRIAHLGRVAHHACRQDGCATLELEHVAEAGWTFERGGFGTLAQPLTERVTSSSFVAPTVLATELQALRERCRVREGLTEPLGAASATRYRPGVRALFVGPSGTGKTLAAGWLATGLALPLYRVDVASVVSKYIGETEKNLAQLLAEAEHAEVVLLFDEADSLFGRRTEVKDSNDRFANAQTNYLLQRIETYEGIVILTSNSKSRFDSSFTRRLDAILDFPLPDAEDRRMLWLSHLGTSHRVTPEQVNLVAAKVNLAGGHIRNVVLAAAARALSSGNGTGDPIHFQHILCGLESEYRKIGGAVPRELYSACG